MDEPFGALDPGSREDLQLFMLELWEELGMTIVFITHDLEEAVFVSTRLAVLSHYYAGSAGSQIVKDFDLSNVVKNTAFKTSEELAQMVREIRHEGFNPAHLQHARDFNLKHPDSFETP
jgi:NitT/TauT family transport system ATP-binding protein